MDDSLVVLFLIIGPSGIEMKDVNLIHANSLTLIIGPSGIEIHYQYRLPRYHLPLIIGPSGIEICKSNCNYPQR